MYYIIELRKTPVKSLKIILLQKLFWPFIVQVNCSSDLKFFENSWRSASFPSTKEQFFLTEQFLKQNTK